MRDDSLDPDAIAPKKGGRPKDTDRAEKIMAALYGAEESGGLSPKRLEKATGIAERTLRRDMQTLIKKGEAIKSHDGTYQLSPKNSDAWKQTPAN